jgi:DNA polymerase-3 subunit delta'
MFEHYPWLEQSWQRLLRYSEHDRLPSALLIAGADGLALLSLVERYAQYVFCTDKQGGAVCEACSACQLFKAGSYPDYILISPEEGESSIKIDATRALTHKLSLSNQYSQQRIVVIHPAEAMPHAAANSLLKTLEEPSENTTIILISYKPSVLPATIRSRCQLLTIKNINIGVALPWLTQQGCEQAQAYLGLADGRPLIAKSLWEQSALDDRNTLFGHFEQLIAGQLDPLAFVEIYVKVKDYPVLTWLTGWFIDAVKISCNAAPNDVLNTDLYPRLKVLLERLHLRQLHALIEQLTELIQLENRSVNKQLMLEDFAINCYAMAHKNRMS